MRSLRRLGLAGLSFLLPACGASAPPPAAPAPAPVHVATTPPAPKPADMSPAAVPSDALAIVRVKNGETVLRGVREILGNTLIPDAITAQAVAQMLLGPSLADVIDLSQPIDLGVAGSASSPELVVSIAVVSISDASQNLAEDFNLTPLEGGVVRIEARNKTTAAASKVRCELRPAAGASPFRLVCAMAPHEPGAMGAYLTRTVARSDMTSEAHLEVFAGDVMRKELANPKKTKKDDAIDAFMTKFLTQLVDDMDRVAIDVAQPPGALEVTLGTTFKRTDSPLTRFLTSPAKTAQPIPDLFWRLPADSDAAIYASGAAAADLEGMRTWASEFVDIAAAQDGPPPEVVARTKKAVLSLALTGGPCVMAYGFDEAAALAAFKKAGAKGKIDRRVLHGWTLVGLEEPTARWTDGIRELMAIDKIRWDRKERPKTDEDEDEDEKKKDDDGDDTSSNMSESPVTDRALPKGTTHFVWRAYPKKVDAKTGKKKNVADTTKPLVSTTHLYVVPADTRTYLAFGENEAQVLTKVKSVLPSSKQKGLAGRTDLQALHTTTTFGGFMSVASFDAMGLPSDASTEKRREKAQTHLEHAVLPVGATVVPFFVPPSTTTDGRRAIELRFHVPSAALREAAAQAQGTP